MFKNKLGIAIDVEKSRIAEFIGVMFEVMENSAMNFNGFFR